MIGSDFRKLVGGIEQRFENGVHKDYIKNEEAFRAVSYTHLTLPTKRIV